MIAIATALVALSLASPPPAEVLQALHRTVRMSDVAISRDGKRVAFLEQVPTPDGPSWDESILQVRDQDGSLKRITAAKAGTFCDEGEADFSPDGRFLAFLSDAEKRHQPQVYLANLDTREVRQLTHANGHLAHPRFSRDGRTLAVLYMENSLDALGPLRAAARQTGVVGETPVEQRLALVQLDGNGDLMPVSPPNLFVYEYGWSPDSKAIVATAAPGSGDDNWWVAKLYLFASGQPARVLYSPKLQICEPAFSPDGQSVAFIEGLMSDQGSNGGDLFVLPAGGGTPRNLTRGFKGSPATLRWLDRKTLLAGTQIEGDAAFLRIAADGSAKPAVLWRGPLSVTTGRSISLAISEGASTTAAVIESFERPPELAIGPIGKWQNVTVRNAAAKSPAGEARSLTWKSDQFDVQGWLLAPAVKPQGKAPMVVVVHGGPAAAVRPSYSDTALLLASQGYYVLLPNPRGSFGQGEKFTEANVKDFGYGDLRDILKGVDTAIAAAPIDPARIGIYGHSYGGYMTMWAVTQTHRFHAAVASAGLANWQSYYGENLIDQWMLPYFGKSVYEDPEVYRRSSPIEFVQRVRTPTLVLHGERDAEVPLPQGQEFWHALKALGVPTQFVVYGDEGHRIRKPANVRDHAERLIGWFDKYLKQEATPNQ
jgi:dipeptidyl aminopeptidase/acylaminoacyl peptidase